MSCQRAETGRRRAVRVVLLTSNMLATQHLFLSRTAASAACQVPAGIGSRAPLRGPRESRAKNGITWERSFRVGETLFPPCCTSHFKIPKMPPRSCNTPNAVKGNVLVIGGRLSPSSQSVALTDPMGLTGNELPPGMW